MMATLEDRRRKMDAAANRRFGGQGIAKRQQDSNDLKGAMFAPRAGSGVLRQNAGQIGVDAAYGFKRRK